MKKESVLVFGDIVRKNRSLFELLDRDSTFVNGELARHYGYSDVQGPQWRRIATEVTERGGLLTQAAVLTVSSSPRRTSPVFRGKWILDVLLGEPPPPPPPNVAELPAEVETDGSSLRELLEIHRKQTVCASCHNRIDPLGLALEQYDAVGRLRKDDRDTTATLLDGEVIDGVAGLKRILLEKKRDSYIRQVARKMLAYALGRNLMFADERPLHAMIAKLEQDEFRVGTLIREMIVSDPFRYRMNRPAKYETPNARATP